MSTKLTLEQVNNLSAKDFHETFVNVVECWPEAAIYVAALTPFHSFDSMIFAFNQYLHKISVEC